MKVGVDGVLLGCLAQPNTDAKVLDIGTGSGLLLLILSQRFPKLNLTGIDININAIEQAKINIHNSPFNNPVSIEHTSIQKLERGSFDFFISNPPFFKGVHPNIGKDRFEARAQDLLPLSELFKNTKRLATDNAKFALIYPIEFESDIFTHSKLNEWYIKKKVVIFGRENKTAKRVYYEFSSTDVDDFQESELIIEIERHKYTEEYKALTKDFYLNF